MRRALSAVLLLALSALIGLARQIDAGGGLVRPEPHSPAGESSDRITTRYNVPPVPAPSLVAVPSSSAFRPWLEPETPKAQAEALVLNLLEGNTPPGGLPEQSYDPRLDATPVPTSFLFQRIWVATGFKPKPPQVRAGLATVFGSLPREVIPPIVRKNFGRFRLCYENGLRNNPNLQGHVRVRFTILQDGSVFHPINGGSDLPDGVVVACVVRSFAGLSFPRPERGLVTVISALSFSPGS